MKAILCGVCCAALTVSGCVSFPELPNGPRVDIGKIVANIECELQRSLKSDFTKHYWLLGWATSITLTLETKNKDGGVGNFVFTVPLHPSALAVGLTGGPAASFNSQGELTYDINLVDIYERTGCSEDLAAPSESLLTGRIGAGDWVQRIADDPAFVDHCPRSIKYNLEFNLDIDANGNPKISGIEIGEGKLDTGLALSHHQSGNHKLAMVATPIPQDEKGGSDNATFAKAATIIARDTSFRVNENGMRACRPIDKAMLAGPPATAVTPATSQRLFLEKLIDIPNDN